MIRETFPQPWTPHTGTRCPLPYATRIHVRLSDGSEDSKPSLAGGWSVHERDRWKRQHDWYIVAYRLAEEVVPLTEVVRLSAGSVIG